jgi:putative Flp pilus-assembly TadE/G-like protein
VLSVEIGSFTVKYVERRGELMRHGKNVGEKGQALILIVFAILGLFGLTALAVDGGNAYSERRAAQDAADSAALAGALAKARGGDISATALAAAATNGFVNNGAASVVTTSIADSPAGVCPGNQAGKDITVQITATVPTYFAPVIGVRSVTNKVAATSRSCDSYIAPPFNGNAIVALSPTGVDFDASGTPGWSVTGGGIFSNSSSTPSTTCRGAANVSSPSITAVGTVSAQCASGAGTVANGAKQYAVSDYADSLPRVPACDGTSYVSGGLVHPEANKDGSTVAFNGNMQFAAGLYCVTNSPGPFHGQISGSGVTFFIVPTNFSLKFNGGGNLTASAPSGNVEYSGVLMFSAPRITGGVLQQTQSIDLRGNGNGDVKGSIILPSADITMFGNSGTHGFNSQIIGYQVDSGGTADINIHYNAGDGYQVQYPFMVSLIR